MITVVTQTAVLLLASVIFVAVALKSVFGGSSPPPPQPPRPSQAPPTDPELNAQIRQLLAQGQKIPAIKLYREVHHCSLKEAKEAVEALE